MMMMKRSEMRLLAAGGYHSMFSRDGDGYVLYSGRVRDYVMV